MHIATARRRLYRKINSDQKVSQRAVATTLPALSLSLSLLSLSLRGQRTEAAAAVTFRISISNFPGMRAHAESDMRRASITADYPRQSSLEFAPRAVARAQKSDKSGGNREPWVEQKKKKKDRPSDIIRTFIVRGRLCIVRTERREIYVCTYVCINVRRRSFLIQSRTRKPAETDFDKTCRPTFSLLSSVSLFRLPFLPDLFFRSVYVLILRPLITRCLPFCSLLLLR